MSTPLVEFWHPGRPITKGSYTPIALCVAHGDAKCGRCTLAAGVRQYVKSSPAMVAWERAVAIAAGEAYRRACPGRPPCPVPVRLTGEFYYQRPLRGGEPYPTAERYGDSDKLLRLLYDAVVKGGVLADDRLVVDGHTRKRWAEPETSGGVVCRIAILG